VRRFGGKLVRACKRPCIRRGPRSPTERGMAMQRFVKSHYFGLLCLFLVQCGRLNWLYTPAFSATHIMFFVTFCPMNVSFSGLIRTRHNRELVDKTSLLVPCSLLTRMLYKDMHVLTFNLYTVRQKSKTLNSCP